MKEGMQIVIRDPDIVYSEYLSSFETVAELVEWIENRTHLYDEIVII